MAAVQPAMRGATGMDSSEGGASASEEERSEYEDGEEEEEGGNPQGGTSVRDLAQQEDEDMQKAIQVRCVARPAGKAACVRTCLRGIFGLDRTQHCF